jgi:hypothetical protein
MPTRTLHHCECAACQQEADHPERLLHQQMNLLFSRLDEQQRRWYAAVEAQRIGHGGILLLAQITGLDQDTISRGRRELANTLEGRPLQKIRLPGGGRPATEKKIQL